MRTENKETVGGFLLLAVAIAVSLWAGKVSARGIAKQEAVDAGHAEWYLDGSDKQWRWLESCAQAQRGETDEG